MTERFGQRLVKRPSAGGARKMSDAQVAPVLDRQDNAKRRQIIDGAREVFLAQGFDAASMGEIARQAGVSKGTLYVYFDSKEALFEATVEAECLVQAEQ